MANYPTPHINARPSDFAKTVLMPGDPLRAKFIAETYLTDPVCINEIRGILGFTGTYRDVPVTVMASGMGMPSIGIYSYELFHFFGVENILRIGSTGSLREDVRVRDLVIGMGASTNSNYAHQFNLPGTLAPIADFAMLRIAVECAEALGVPTHVGNILSSDAFYGDDPTANERWRRMGVLCVEMEAAALYMNAARAGKRALAIFTVSDHLVTGESTTAEERQNSFTQMMEVALETAVRLEKL